MITVAIALAASMSLAPAPGYTPYVPGHTYDHTDVIRQEDTAGLTYDHWVTCDNGPQEVNLGTSGDLMVVIGDVDGSGRLETDRECRLADAGR